MSMKTLINLNFVYNLHISKSHLINFVWKNKCVVSFKSGFKNTHGEHRMRKITLQQKRRITVLISSLQSSFHISQVLHIFKIYWFVSWSLVTLVQDWRNDGAVGALREERPHWLTRLFPSQFYLLAYFTTQSLTLVRNPSWSLLKWSAASMLSGSSKLSRSEKREERPQSTSRSRLENMQLSNFEINRSLE